MRATILTSACLLFTMTIGCGSGSRNATDYHVQGTVQFDGQPLPAGTIYFTPDTSKGNSGPQGAAAIKNGTYDTRESRFGIMGGPYRVVIEGYNGIPPQNDEDGLFSHGEVLFRNYEVALEFSKQNQTHDFDIPKSAVSNN